MKLQWVYSLLIFAFLTLLTTGCATYRVVELGSGVDERGIVSRFYAVTRNNVVIPEYVVDLYGNYPTTAEEAEDRFQTTRASVEPYLKDKYSLPNDFLYQLGRVTWGGGFVLVSPFAIPMRYLGEAFSAKEKKKGFSQVVGDYFRSSFTERTYKRPKVRETVDDF